MQDIIDKLSGADGPSRELDAEIAKACGENVTMSSEIVPKPCDSAGNYLPAYTASLDAAMTLVPEGTMVSVGRWKHCEAGTWHWSAQILPVCRIVESHEHHEAEAATGPLALCIASLKARTNQKTGE